MSSDHRDATSGEPAGPVPDADPPASSVGGPLRPSGPPPGSPVLEDELSTPEGGETGGADAVGSPDAEAADGGAAEDEDFDPVIDALTTERDLYRDMAQRVQADFENFRKRARAQALDDVERATGRLAEALLPVLDATEAAYVRHPEEVGPLLNLLLGELRKQGLEALDLEGEAFDPNLADAVAHEPGEGGEVVVAEVLRSGYTWNGRTLRPAMVRTADRDVAPRRESVPTDD